MNNLLNPDTLRLRFSSPAPVASVAGDSAAAALQQESYTPAAVLVPVVDRENGMTVLFTRRTAHLQDHAGQISFPGGRTEPGDESPLATALRETEEEIGLERGCVEILGRLPDYRTGTGFRITPVVGLVRPPLELRPDDFEVAEVFEVPLGFLLDPSNHQRNSMMRDGHRREFYAMPYRHYYIWGATAGILMNLYSVLTSQS
ncbi:MAG: coenzyme A pyrophosphatase [Betaproteobacteria bacterium RIFCSPLOWO2_12_FULL_66_14]|nr:MAG: coenzyme A pyrophosphatase [Betaproteobacteria bacterium RIFCSPLOWO2_12_FULL_66_14]